MRSLALAFTKTYHDLRLWLRKRKWYRDWERKCLT